MKAIRFIIEIFKKYPGLLLSNIAAAIVMSFLGILSFCLLTPIIDMFLYPGGQGHSPLTLKVIGVFKAVGLPVSLTCMISALVIMVVITSIVQVLGNMLILKTKYSLLKDMMLGAFEDFFNAKWLFFSSSEQGKIYSTLNRELGVIGDGFVAIGTIFTNLIQAVILLAVPFYISWKETLLCLGFGGLALICFNFLGKSSYHLGRQNTDTANVLSGLIYENIGGAKLVLGYGNSKQLLGKIRRAYDAHLDCTIRSQVVSYIILTAYRPVSVVIVVIVLFTSRKFAVPVSEVMVLLLALLQVMNSLGNLVAQKSLLSNIVPGFEQIQSLRQRARGMSQDAGTLIYQEFKRDIILEGVSFSYPGRDLALDDINIQIPKGRTVAFVGKSGAGKSTMIDLLMGFHQPSSGKVMIDGVSLTDYEINSYRGRLGYVPQDNVLFNMSIRDNLLWAKPDAKQEEIVEACRLAFADEFITDLPQVYDTIVGDRGVRLSGGQIQRLALARAFLKKPDILIFDEATSSLDSHSEILIQKSIEEVAKKKTVILIAHRLSTIKNADCIYLLEKGRVIEQGSYEELIRRRSDFSSMAQLQELGIIKE